SFHSFHDRATAAICRLPLHDALPILPIGVHRPRAWGSTPIVLLHQRDYSDAGLQVAAVAGWQVRLSGPERTALDGAIQPKRIGRSEEHTSELQSRVDLVCRLLLEKKK